MRAAVAGILALALTTQAYGQSVDEALFEMRYFPARTAHLCNVTTEAEALRLSAAIAAEYAAKTRIADNRLSIPPERFAALRARLDARKPTAKECEAAARYVPSLQADYPPGGKVERNPPGSAAWEARTTHATNAAFIAQGRACNLLSAAEAAELLQRAEAAPMLTFHWTPAEIADATAMGVERGRRQPRCQGLADVLALVRSRIAEAETGWHPAR